MAPHTFPQDAEPDVAPEASRPRRDEQVAQFRGWPVGAPIAAVLTDTTLADGLGLGLTAFYARKNAGHFAFLELNPQLPASNTRYSGALVSRWLNGEHVAAPAPTTRRFFGKAAPAAQVIAMPARRGRRPGRPRKSSGANQSVHAAESRDAVAAGLLKEIAPSAERW